MTKTAFDDPLINISKEFYDNPYPTLARMRNECPVVWSEKGQYWLVTRYTYALEILGDLHFEKAARRWKQIDMLAKLIPNLNRNVDDRGKHMLNANPPDHTRLRSLVNKAFTPSMVIELKPRIEKIVEELLDAVQSKHQMDLMEDFAFPLPAIVISEMLGIPIEDRDRFKHWSHNITAALDPNPNPNFFNLAKVVHSYSELESYLKPLIQARRKERRNDLISNLVAAEEDGNKLTEGELLANIVLLLIAGHETTTNLIGNGSLALLRHPDQLEKLKSEPELIGGAVTEILRYDSPVQMMRRIAGEDIEVGGQVIKADQALLILIGAANRDPEQFPNPDAFDIIRSPNKHLSFGHGIHHCLGSSLAETEGKIAISRLLERMPNIKLSGEKLEYKHPFSLRGVKKMAVTF